MRRCSTLVLLPVGPGTELEFLEDTLESIRTFALPDHLVLLMDDSGQGLAGGFAMDRPNLEVLTLRQPGEDPHRTVAGVFFEKVAKGIRHAVERLDFQALMRLDADALMTNPGADEKGIDYLARNPDVGLIGSHRVRCDGQPRDFKRNAEIIRKETGFQLAPARRALAQSWRALLNQATPRGYEPGENVIAPGCMLSRRAAEALAAHPLFGHPSFRPSRLGDDHILSLMVYAVGFRLDDFATGDRPLAVWLRKIEWSPEEVVGRGKAVAHSVRGYQELNEAQVRERFRKLRQRTPTV